MKKQSLRIKPWNRHPHPEDCRHIWMSGICVKCGVAISDIFGKEGKAPPPHCKP